jgi:hypothetical protein
MFCPLVTRDIVATDTPADFATSLKVTIARKFQLARLLNNPHAHSAIDDEIFTSDKVVFKQSHD